MSSSSPNPALANMQDIQLPADIGWWPLAPGIWAVAIISLLLILFASIWLIKVLRQRRQQRAAAKEALVLLDQLDSDDPQLPVILSALLKRTAISYGQRQDVAGLTDDNWYHYLDQVLPEAERGQFANLLQHRYRRPGATIDGRQLLQLTRSWLQHAPQHFGKKAQTRNDIKEAAC
ncbi:DUF4381 domain-containing protein [Shewanella mangrovi]|uniref:DUF4381 domain-containing protein n=1 Tax=Shewanella mangrovi TaxID=1515746 RepID=UPI00138E4CC1|nr:DUF4381 domain-containing protein [Shewanella mangrovi]